MAKDFTVMKTSLFGGFKKSDVLNLIEQLQAETSDVKESLDIKREEVLELKNKISTLEEKLDELSSLSDTLQEKENEIAVLNEKLEAALLEMSGTTPNYFMIVDRVNNLDTLEIQLELDPKYYTDEVRAIEALTKKIGHVIQQALGISAKIKLVEPQTLVRSQGKAVHVTDKRKLY